MTPVSVTIKATSAQGSLELVLPVQILDQPGETIHQLAAKNAMQELEEGRGWITEAKDQEGKFIKERYPGRFDEMVEREAVRIGVEFQVGGRWCSFVAVEANDAEITKTKSKVPVNLGAEVSVGHENDDFEMVEQEPRRPEIQSTQNHPMQSMQHRQMHQQVRAMVQERGQPFQVLQMGSQQAAFASANSSHQSLSMPSPQRGSPRSYKDAPNGRGPIMQPQLSSFSGGGSSYGNSLPPRRYLSSNSHGASTTAEDQDEDMVDFSDEEMGLRFYSGKAPSPMKKAKKSAGKSTPEHVKLEGLALLHHLINTQTFDGSWALDSLPRDAMGFKDEPVQLIVQELARQFGAGDDKVAEAVATAMVVVFLDRMMAEEREAWELVVDKARAWLEGKFGDDLVERVGRAQLGW